MFGFVKVLLSYVAIAFLALMIIFLAENLYSTHSYKRKNKVDFRSALKEIVWKPKIMEFFKWLAIDIYRVHKYGRTFNRHGFHIHVGEQGDGKTIAMTWEIEQIKKEFPDCKVYTNFYYTRQDGHISSWRDLLDMSKRNGLKGTVFAWDELHQDYNQKSWEDFPEDLFSQISYLRKDKIYILASAQDYGTVVKDIRRQCREVIVCSTIGNRWTFMKSYKARHYEPCLDNPEKLAKITPLWKKSFVHTDKLRLLYDTDKKADKLRDTKFLPREKRVNKSVVHL